MAVVDYMIYRGYEIKLTGSTPGLKVRSRPVTRRYSAQIFAPYHDPSSPMAEYSIMGQDRERVIGRAQAWIDDDIQVKTSKNKPEPAPQPHNGRPAVWDLVIADIEERDRMGAKKYGTRLQPHNGRSPLRDAYQEALDLVVYLRQAIYEAEGS